MNQLKFGRNVLLLALLSLFTAMVWIGYEVYHAYSETTVPQIITKLIQPLSPTLDQEVFQAIKEKQLPSDEELNLMPTSAPSPSPEAGIEEEVETGEFEEEETEENSPSQTATESGNFEER